MSAEAGTVDAVRTPERRLHLDGLRAVAVGLVLLFHSSVDRLEGGFVGVDVFFVLSGYLVTDVLLRDARAGRGLRWGRFYSRRVRRLLPASIVTILVTGAVFASLGGLFAREQLADTMRACLLYVANWHFIATSADYFAQDEASPLLHLWSLAVEEQFYLVWPIVLAGALAVGRRTGRWRWWTVRLLVVVAGLASLGAALALQGSDLDLAYFGTGTRAYQLLAGAALALTPAVVQRVATRPIVALGLAGGGLAGILLVSTWIVDVEPITRGALVTVTTLAALVGLDAAPRSLAARALSLGPLVYLGQISYGIYLWHWPVVLGIDELVEVSTTSRVLLVGLLSVGIASASYHLLEEPIRTARLRDALRWPVVGAGLATSVLAALVAVPLLTDTTTAAPETATVELASGTPVPSTEELRTIRYLGYADHTECVDDVPEACTLVEGSGPHVLLIGDSLAEATRGAFVRMAEEHDLTFSSTAIGGCPWQRDLYVLTDAIKEQCRRVRTDAYDRVIPALDPDIVVAVSAPPVPGRQRDPSVSSRNDTLRRTTDASIAELQDGHRQVVVIEALPRPPDEDLLDPLDCMTRARFVEECRFVADAHDSWYDEHLRTAAEADPLLATLDVRRLVCPYDPICDPIVDGDVVFWDEQHLTRQRSAAIGPALGDAFVAAGLLPPDG